MNKSIRIYLLLSTFFVSFMAVRAQHIPDSTMQKIYGFRAFYEKLGNAYPPDSTVQVAETNVAGVKSYWFSKALLNKRHIVIYLHGGAYAYGNISAYRAMLTHQARSLDLPVLYVEYSLSPEHPFPAANSEILKVYQELQRQYPGYKISIIGDSAGGGLAITLVYDAQKSKVPMPSSLALISPWIDLKGENKSYDTKQAVDPILTKTFLRDHAAYYAGNRMREADPSEKKFKAFPPVLLLVGSDEILNDDARNFYAYIKNVQPLARFKEFPRQKHVWPFSDFHSPSSVEAINDIKQYIK